GLRLVKGGVEASHLRNMGRGRLDRLNRRQIMRLVKRSQGAKLFQRCDYIARDDGWLGERGAAVDDAMAHASHVLSAEEPDRSFEDNPRCLAVIELGGLPLILDDLLSVRILSRELRRNADIFDLAAEKQLLILSLEQGKLDA